HSLSTLSLHDALPIFLAAVADHGPRHLSENLGANFGGPGNEEGAERNVRHGGRIYPQLSSHRSEPSACPDAQRRERVSGSTFTADRKSTRLNSSHLGI